MTSLSFEMKIIAGAALFVDAGSAARQHPSGVCRPINNEMRRKVEQQCGARDRRWAPPQPRRVT
jgi:hypothetical protein